MWGQDAPQEITGLLSITLTTSMDQDAFFIMAVEKKFLTGLPQITCPLTTSYTD
jgi:hypothetical protein